MKKSDKEIEKLWKEFGNVPLNENEELEDDFYIWEKGTDKEYIWHWFDENHSIGVYHLLYHLK